ncbi:hypothetical protein VNO77_02963 [Canavalia gladiata]|uniref:Uncharacterized protein n=1 Tax=Canavalia gladiata TaxID=3824 RepID=A0AAN9MU15_CANGL
MPDVSHSRWTLLLAPCFGRMAATMGACSIGRATQYWCRGMHSARMVFQGGSTPFIVLASPSFSTLTLAMAVAPNLNLSLSGLTQAHRLGCRILRYLANSVSKPRSLPYELPLTHKGLVAPSQCFTCLRLTLRSPLLPALDLLV